MSFRIDQLAVLNLATVGNSITAGSFVKSGGTSSQFLKADGTVDTNAYITGITSTMVTTALGYTPVPNTRNITINGVTQDLSVDRTWTISAGVSSVTGSGSGISVSPTTGAVVVSNTGVTSNVAGTGISVSGATGAVTITNTGVTSIVAGTAITISGATGAVTINNAGVTSVNGGTGAITGIATTAQLAGYLPLSGGTMTGVITTPNGTHGIIIGDDSRLADRNIANTLFVEGVQNNDRGYINFSSTSGNSLGAINGGALTWNSNVILHAANYNSYAPTLTGTGASGTWAISISGNSATTSQTNFTTLTLNSATVATQTWVTSQGYITSASVGNGTLTMAVSGTGLSGSASFTANQSGNTTFTVTSNATSANTASTIVARDSSGNFIAGRITTTGLYGPSTSGNIPIWQYDASNTGYGIVYNEDTPDTLRIDVSGNALAGTPDLLVGPDYAQINGNTVLHAGNYNSYAPTLTGGGASGTWSINITGTAGSETLSTVTGRGASTSTFSTFSGGASVGGGALYFRGSSTEYITGEAWATAHYGYNNNDGFLFYQRDASNNPHPTFHIGGNNNASYGGWSTADGMITLVRGDGTKQSGTSYAYRGLSDSAYYTNIVKTTSATVFNDAQGVHQFNASVRASTDMRAPIFYDSDNTAYYLNPTDSATSLRINGGIAQNDIVGRPAAYWGSTGTTGAVVIKFPGNAGNYGMVHAVIDIYEYNGNDVCTVIVGGHNWNGAWYNFGAQVIGATDKLVRVGVKDNKYCIVIGNAGSSWSYGQVVLRKIQNGTYYSGIMDVAGGYTVAIESDTYSWISGDLRNLETPVNFYAGGSIYAGGNIVATQSWVNSQGFVTGGPFVPLRGVSNWNDNTVINNVVGMLAWKNYGGNHVIFDASNSTTPSGASCNNTNPQIAWSSTYPTLMGWNGSNTYGVRVDSAKLADVATSANLASNAVVNAGNASAAWYPIVWHSGNTLYSSSGTAEIYPAGGYIRVSYFNSTDNDESGITRFVIKNGDNYHRSATTTTAMTIIRGVASGSWGINASSATQVVTIQDAVPSGVNGQLWWESDTGRLKVYYGASSSWVDATAIPDMSLYYPKAGGVINGDVGIQQTLTVVGNTLIQGTLTETSDISLKENIIPLNSSLDKVMKLKGVSFNKKATPELKEIGFIAQEVEAVIPDLVTETKEGIKTVSYSRVTAVLVETIKEQQVQINELKNLVSKLTDKLNNL